MLCKELFQALERIPASASASCWSNARQSLAIADRGYLMENGRIVAEGSAVRLKSEPAVQQAYLGGALAYADLTNGGLAASPHQLPPAEPAAALLGRTGGVLSTPFAAAADRPSRSSPMFEVPLLIENDDRAAAGGATFDRFNPLTAEVASRAAAASLHDARGAADAAALAFRPGHRRHRLRAARSSTRPSICLKAAPPSLPP